MSNDVIVPTSNIIDFVVPEPKIIKICFICHEPVEKGQSKSLNIEINGEYREKQAHLQCLRCFLGE
jgi:hypothetical protein